MTKWGAILVLLLCSTAGATTYYAGPSDTGDGSGSGEINLKQFSDVDTETSGGDTIYLVNPDTTIFYEYENSGTVLAPVDYVEWPDRIYYSKKIIQYGITVDFNDTYQRIFRFINGDYCVVGPVTISAYTPACTTDTNGKVINGMMINPGGALQGLDQRSESARTWDAALSLGDDLPQTISTYPSTVVIAKSLPAYNSDEFSYLETGMVLTVTDTGLANNNWFAPSYHDYTGRAIEYEWADVNTAVIASVSMNCTRRLRQITGDVRWPTTGSSLERQVARRWIETVAGWAGEYSQPIQNMPGYGVNYCQRLGECMLAVHDSSLGDINDRKRLLISLVQIGVDFGGIYRDGQASWWAPNGGHRHGRYWPILFAGLVLDDPNLSGIGVDTNQHLDTNTETMFFQENNTTFIVTSDWVAATPYQIGYIETLRDKSDSAEEVCSVQNGSAVVTGHTGETWPGVVADMDDGDLDGGGDRFITITGLTSPYTVLDEVRGVTWNSTAYRILSIDRTVDPPTLTLNANYEGNTNSSAYFLIAYRAHLGTQYNASKRNDYDEFTADHIGAARWTQYGTGAVNAHYASPTYNEDAYENLNAPNWGGHALSAILMENSCGAVTKWNSPPFWAYMQWFRDQGKSFAVTWIETAADTYWDLGITPPSKATTPYPSHTATNILDNAVLTWAAATGATSYDVYFGTDNTPDESELIGNQATTSYDPELAWGTTYYWRIDSVNDVTTTGDVWSFTTLALATKASNASPADTATDVAQSPLVSWTGPADTYDVYFSTNQTLVTNKDAGAKVASSQSGTTYTPGKLTYGETYYWRVISKNAAGDTDGDVWSFTILTVTTETYLLVVQ